MSTELRKCKGSDKNTDCPLRTECYRFTKEPEQNQKYYENVPYEENGGRCDFYLPHWVIDELKTKPDATNNRHPRKKRG